MVMGMTVVLSPLVWIVGLVAIQRLIELAVSAHNTQRLLKRGWREVGAEHYPLFVLLHASWLLAIAVLTPLTGGIGILITGTVVDDWHAWAVAHHYAFSL